MLGKAERPWRIIIRDNASALIHCMYIFNSMWRCAVSIVIYLCNHTFSRAVGPSGGVPVTLLALVEPNAYKFRVFGYTFFAKVPNKLHRKLGEKASRGVMVGYLSHAPMDRVDSPVTRRTTTSMLVMVKDAIPASAP
jgi:hypothetical protein